LEWAKKHLEGAARSSTNMSKDTPYDEPVSEKVILPLLGVSSRSLMKLRQQGLIPFIKYNPRVIRYDVGLVLEAKKEMERTSK
jgi:hypothetical protein